MTRKFFSPLKIFVISALSSLLAVGLLHPLALESSRAQGDETVADAAVLDSSAQARNDAQYHYGAQPIGKYEELDVRAGVHNNGQAALWDLHIFDYFRIFGPPQRARGYRPEQPIRFSHITHVQQNKMECQYCHHTVAKAAFAAIPEVETCMGCHKVVSSSSLKRRSDDATESSEKARLAAGAVELQKLENYWTKGEAIPWVKVHVQPDYVHFNHKRHVKAGVSCQECHGQVPNMEVVERVSSMKMGWCLDCHRTRGASIDCYSCHY